LSFTPPFNLGTFKQCQEVTTLGNGVFGNVGFSIHQHEPFELSQELNGSGLIAIKCFGRIPFKPPVFGVLLLIII